MKQHQVQIDLNYLSLHKKLLTDTNDSDFVELMRIENGDCKEHSN